MNNLIRGELYKLGKGNYFIGMIFFALVGTWVALVQYNDNIRLLDKFNPELMSGMYSIKFSYRCILFTSFLYAIFAAQFIAKDLKQNMSKSFVYGYKRSKVIVSKLIVFILCCLCIELIYTAVLVYNGRDYWFEYNVENVLYLLRIICIGTLYNVATISIIAMISIITKSRVCTVVSPILFLLSFSILDSQTFISTIVAYISPFIMGEAALARFAPTSDIVIGIVSSVLSLVMTIGVSLLYVKHEDVK